MKKCIVLFLVFSAFSLSGENDDVNCDGFDWVGYSKELKCGVIIGYGTALASIQVARASTKGDYQEVENFNEKFAVPGTVGDLIDEVDRYYSDYQKRPITLVIVLLQITGLWEKWEPGFVMPAR